MRGLLGDRFLRRFTGDLKHEQKHDHSTSEEQNPEAIEDTTQEPEAVEPEVNTSEGDHKEADEGADAKAD